MAAALGALRGVQADGVRAIGPWAMENPYEKWWFIAGIWGTYGENHP